MKELFILPWEGTPIHSMRKDFLFLRGSERDASTDHIILAGVINLALPINLLDGLRWWGAVFMVLLLLVPLEALLRRQFSWMKASLLFVFHFSVLFQLIVRCIVLFFASFA
jgi:hypothetical protein